MYYLCFILLYRTWSNHSWVFSLWGTAIFFDNEIIFLQAARKKHRKFLNTGLNEHPWSTHVTHSYPKTWRTSFVKVTFEYAVNIPIAASCISSAPIVSPGFFQSSVPYDAHASATTTISYPKSAPCLVVLLIHWVPSDVAARRNEAVSTTSNLLKTYLFSI